MKARIMNLLQDYLFLKNGSCPVCGKVLFVTNDFLCANCREELPMIRGPICHSCGRPLQIKEKQRCLNCRKENYPFSGGMVFLHYQQMSQKMIYALKFKNHPNLGVFLGEEMSRELCEKAWVNELEILVPIPIHDKRRSERGYNQSEKIAEGIIKGLGKTKFKMPELETDLLIRSMDTPHQIGQSREKRRQNMLGAFDIRTPQALENKKILLVDDVLTTGATLAEAAHTLLDAGAQKVYIAVIAALDD